MEDLLAADVAHESPRSTPSSSLARAAAVVVPFVLMATVLVALAFRLPPPSTDRRPSTNPPLGSRASTASPTPTPIRSSSGDEVSDVLVPAGLALESERYQVSIVGDGECRQSCEGVTAVIARGDAASVLAIYDGHLRGHGLARWPAASRPGDHVWVGRAGKATTRVRIRAMSKGSTSTVEARILRGPVPNRAALEEVFDAFVAHPTLDATDYPDHHAPTPAADPRAKATLTLRSAQSVEKSLRAISDAFGFEYEPLGKPCRGASTTAYWLAIRFDILLTVSIRREAGVTTAVLTSEPRPDAGPAVC